MRDRVIAILAFVRRYGQQMCHARYVEVTAST